MHKYRLALRDPHLPLQGTGCQPLGGTTLQMPHSAIWRARAHTRARVRLGAAADADRVDTGMQLGAYGEYSKSRGAKWGSM
eukprot:600240-Pleurochrysis_carterae.AAC.1